MQIEIRQTRVELNTKIDETRVELQTNIDELRREMNDGFRKLAEAANGERIATNGDRIATLEGIVGVTYPRPEDLSQPSISIESGLLSP